MDIANNKIHSNLNPPTLTKQMKILVINCGSSSLKFSLFEIKKEYKEIAKGHIDRIGLTDTKFTFKSADYNLGLTIKCTSHTKAVELAINTLLKSKSISKISDIHSISHRVVQGGEKYKKATIVTAQVIKDIDKLSVLAPLHNPINLEGILACKKFLPRIKQVVIFDTSFFQTLPEKAYLYAIPKELHAKFGIRKYGAHGTNHKYVTNKAIKLLNNRSNLKIISCHLGNGSSMTASINGIAIDTSMGLTPMEGLPMGTRSGAIDPSAVIEIQKIKKLTPDKTADFLNSECGLKALSGGFQDMRDIYARYLKKDRSAVLAIEYLSYSIAKYIGSYTSAMNGLDAIVFTGGLGEKAFYVREKSCEYLSYLGVKLDKLKNKNCAEIISDKQSKVKVFVIEADENIQMAIETSKIK